MEFELRKEVTGTNSLSKAQRSVLLGLTQDFGEFRYEPKTYFIVITENKDAIPFLKSLFFDCLRMILSLSVELTFIVSQSHHQIILCTPEEAVEVRKRDKAKSIRNVCYYEVDAQKGAKTDDL